MRELDVVGVRVEMPSNAPMVLLREVGGTRFLPIWIGANEASAIANAQEGDHHTNAQRLHAAGDVIWGRSRDHQQSSTVADLFTEAGLDHDPELLTAYWEFWEPHTFTDPAVRPTWEALRADGIKVGVLSNTIWPRVWHERIFARDGVLDLLEDAATR